MSEMTVIEPVAGESENLGLHTELCAQRYNQLIAKFDEMDTRLDELKGLVSEIRDRVADTRATQLETYLKWAGGIIMTFSGVIAGLFMHLFAK